MKSLEVGRPWWLLPVGRVHPLWWVAIGAVVVWIDYLTGPNVQAPVVYAVPVILAAWYSGRWASLSLAIAMPIVHYATLVGLSSTPVDLTTLAATTAIRAVIVAFVGLWFARLAAHERALDTRVKVLEGLLPICSFCKKIRNEAGEWERLEAYIEERSTAAFSHGFCPSCGKTHYGGMLDEN